MSGVQPGSDLLGRQRPRRDLRPVPLPRASGVASGRLRDVLDELIQVETRHVAFWQEFFGLRAVALDPAAGSGW